MNPDDKIEMTTLTRILEKLRLKNFDNEFNMTEEGFTSGNKKFYQPDNLKIIRTYRFEGETDPSDNAILYLLEANDGHMGYSLDSYGAYSDQPQGFDDFIRKIPMEERDEQEIFKD